jgi:hypothetical protein
MNKEVAQLGIRYRLGSENKIDTYVELIKRQLIKPDGNFKNESKVRIGL